MNGVAHRWSRVKKKKPDSGARILGPARSLLPRPAFAEEWRRLPYNPPANDIPGASGGTREASSRLLWLVTSPVAGTDGLPPNGGTSSPLRSPPDLPPPESGATEPGNADSGRGSRWMAGAGQTASVAPVAARAAGGGWTVAGGVSRAPRGPAGRAGRRAHARTAPAAGSPTGRRSRPCGR